MGSASLAIVSPVLQRCWNNCPVKLPSTAKPATQSDPSVSVVTKRSPCTLPSGAPRPRNTNSAARTSARQATSVSVSQNTSTWASSTIPPSVSTEWTSTAVCHDPVREWPDGDGPRPRSAETIKFTRTTPSSGSRLDLRVLCDKRLLWLLVGKEGSVQHFSIGWMPHKKTAPTL